jgi:NAD+ synthase (glutamine-hydrolysing)
MKRVEPLRLACGQVDFVVGDPRANARRALEVVAEARGLGVDVLLLPELALTGYPPEDLLLQPSFVEANLEALDLVAAGVGADIVVVVGFVDRGAALANALAVVQGGAVRVRYHKQVLPNYTVFDEMRYFRPGPRRSAVFEVNGVRLGLAICEDAWAPTGAIRQAAVDGAEYVLVANASPFETGRQGERERLMAVRAADASVGIVYCNLVGGQDELVFDGGSFVVDETGRLLARAPRFVEDLLVLDLWPRHRGYRKRLIDPRGELVAHRQREPRAVLALERRPRPVLPEEPAPRSPIETGFDPDEVIAAIILGTCDYVAKNGFGGVLVAISGGIDSAVVAALAVRALGPERVRLVGMPSRYSSESSLTDAAALAANLGCPLSVVPIEAAHEALAGMIGAEVPVEGLVEENLQSRIRGVVMMALSNATGWLVLTTGNKSELAVGYSTLYGDTAGGFGLIKDLYKTQVYEVAKALNREAEVIPSAILAKPPSAELRPGQLDTDSLPPYPVLDAVLEALVDEDASVDELAEQGFDRSLAARIARMVDRAEYKRRQSPIGVRLTHKAFGKDRRVPISRRELEGA